jgi:vitamin B12 transporter
MSLALRSQGPVIVLAITLCTPTLGAQSDSTRLDSLVRLAPAVTTASRTPALPGKIGIATSVVTRDVLARQSRGYAHEQLARLPAISLDEAAGPGGPTIIRIRGGEEVFSQVLMDGVQVNQNGGFFDFLGLTLTNVDRIEVARGPQSALYGSSAVNGVVQFITRPGARGPARLRARLEGGGASSRGGTLRSEVGVLGGGERLRYSAAVGTAWNQGIQRVSHDARTREGSVRLDLAPRDGITMELVSRVTGVSANLPVRDPGETRVPLDPNARNTRDRFTTSLRTTVARSARSAHTLLLAVSREEFVYDDRQDGVTGTGFFVFDADFTLDSRFTRTVAEYVWRHSAGPMAIAAGGQLDREALSSATSGDYGANQASRARDNVAGFVEARLTRGRWSVLGGVRAERTRDVPTQLSPRVSATADLAEGRLRWRAAAGRAFKAPNLEQRYLDNPFIVSNPDLSAETSWSYETGVLLRPTPRFSLETSVFLQDYADLIRTVAYDADPSRQINRNLGEARATGVEMEATQALPRGWTAAVNATWLTTEIRANTGLNGAEYPVGGTLPFRPNSTMRGWVDGPIGRRVRGVLEVTVVGAQTVLSERFSGRRERIEAYALLGTIVEAELGRGVSTYLRASNLLGAEYATGFDRRGVPRAFAIGVRWGE